MPGKQFMAIILAIALFIGAFIIIPDWSIQAHTLVVTAGYVEKAPKDLDDPVWSRANAVQLLVEGRENSDRVNGTVTARAVYSRDKLYFLFKWKDPTRSTVKRSWRLMGQNGITSKATRIGLPCCLK